MHGWHKDWGRSAEKNGTPTCKTKLYSCRREVSEGTNHRLAHPVLEDPGGFIRSYLCYQFGYHELFPSVFLFNTVGKLNTRQQRLIKPEDHHLLKEGLANGIQGGHYK